MFNLKNYQKVNIVEYNNIVPKNVFVSVVVVTYNHVNYIRECLNGILSQRTNFEYEIILGDDESNDGTRKICEEYAQKFPSIIRFFLHSRANNIRVNNRPTGRFNFLYNLNMTNGKYICYCEGDDYWIDSYKLSKQVDYFSANNDFGLVHTDFDTLNINTNRILKSYNHKHKKEIPTGNITGELFNNYCIKFATVCFKKELLKHIPVHDFMDIPMGDWPFFVIMSNYTKVGYLRDSTVVYRYGQKSVTNIDDYDDAEKYIDAGDRVNQYLCTLFPEKLTYNLTNQQIYKHKTLLNIAFKNRDYKTAKKHREILIKKNFKSKKVFYSGNMFLFRIYYALKSLNE